MSRYQPGAVARAGTALSFGLAGVALFHAATSAQDRLKTMPGYAQYQKVSAQLNGAVRSGAISGTWSADSASVEYVLDGKRYRFDVATRSATELGAAPDAGGRGGRGGGRGGTGIERGRQAATADAPDGKLKAFYRDRNLWVSDADGGNESAITTDGNDKDRIKYRYGELGLRRRAQPDECHLVVARQPQSRVLPFRRKTGHRLQPPDRSNENSEHQRRRGLPQGRRGQPDCRSLRLRRRHEEEHESRRSQRQALRQRRRRALRLPRFVVARRA